MDGFDGRCEGGRGVRLVGGYLPFLVHLSSCSDLDKSCK